MSRSSGAARQRRAVHRLQPLGVLELGRKAAGDVDGEWLAADGDGIDVDELASREHGDRRRAAAEVDAGAAELRLVVDQRGQAAGIGRGDHALDRQVAAVDGKLEIAERRLRRR